MISPMFLGIGGPDSVFEGRFVCSRPSENRIHSGLFFVSRTSPWHCSTWPDSYNSHSPFFLISRRMASGARSISPHPRLPQKQGRKDESPRMPSEFYAGFTEGLDTAYLKDAKSLVDSPAQGEL